MYTRNFLTLNRFQNQKALSLNYHLHLKIVSQECTDDHRVRELPGSAAGCSRSLFLFTLFTANCYIGPWWRPGGTDTVWYGQELCWPLDASRFPLLRPLRAMSKIPPGTTWNSLKTELAATLTVRCARWFIFALKCHARGGFNRLFCISCSERFTQNVRKLVFCSGGLWAGILLLRSTFESVTTLLGFDTLHPLFGLMICLSTRDGTLTKGYLV